MDRIPLDIWELVFDELATDQEDISTLARSARVTTQWTDLALSRLYLHLNIKSETQASALASCGALERYRRHSMEVFGIGARWKEVEQIIDRSEGVKEITLWCDAKADLLPVGLLTRPSLHELHTLALYARLEGGAPPTPLVVPFQLRTLKTSFQNDELEVLKAIVKASTSGEASTLQHLEASYVHSLEGLSIVATVAATLTSLVWSLSFSSSSDDLILPFLSLPISLNHLVFSTHWQYDLQESCLADAMALVGAPLKSLTLDFAFVGARFSDVLEMVENGLSTWSACRNLLSLQIALPTNPAKLWEPIERLAAWSSLKDAVRRKGVKFVVKDSVEDS